MTPFTFQQWAVVVLVLVLGWILGLLSARRSGRRDRHGWASERDAYDTRLRAANARIAELERHAPAVTAGTGASIAAAARGDRDDLSLIRGVGRDGEVRLNEAGYHRYRDIEALSASDEAALEGRLGAEPGLISRDRWREQASLLRADKHDEHRTRFS